jgi:hypothetical protein
VSVSKRIYICAQEPRRRPLPRAVCCFSLVSVGKQAMFRNNTTKIRFIGLSIPAFTRSGHYLCTFCLKKTCPTRRDNRHMLQDAILQCETSTKFTREARPRRVGPKRRGRAHESRSRFVDMNDQWTFQCEIQKRHPLRDETSTDETTPKAQTRPTSAASRTKPRACIWTSNVPALWSVTYVCQCQTHDSGSEYATGYVKCSSVSSTN